MEGFGLPVLESLAAGTIIVTSDADALVEASQGYSMTFARGHVESLSDALQSALDLPERERVQRISEGIAFAKTQTWQTTVKLTVEAYAEILT
jgi:glycosyltransferase involved in cell wall biosynthesis